jgi:hypothetical protein
VRLTLGKVYLILPALLLVQSPLFPQSSPGAAVNQPATAEAPATTPPPAATTSDVAPAAAGAAPREHAVLPGDPGSTIDKRILGVLPNYRTADGTTPFIPLTTKQKFTIAMKDTFDYPSYILAAAFAGLYQLDDSNPEFGQGLKGYARRYGSAVADQDLGNIMTEGLFPSLLHEDPRYFRKVNGSFKSRLAYASTRTIVDKSDAGHWRFNASEWLGNGTVAAIGNWYYPDDRGFSSTVDRMLLQVGTDTVSNILKEFWPDIKRKWFHKGTGTNDQKAD